MTVIPLHKEWIEIGQVIGEGRIMWMMVVHDAESEAIPVGTPDRCYCELFDTRDRAIDAAKTWAMPIVFPRETGTITSVRAA